MVAEGSVRAQDEDPERGRRGVGRGGDGEERGGRRRLFVIVVVKGETVVIFFVIIIIVVVFGDAREGRRRAEPADERGEVRYRLPGSRLRREDRVGRREQVRDRRGLWGRRTRSFFKRARFST